MLSSPEEVFVVSKTIKKYDQPMVHPIMGIKAFRSPTPRVIATMRVRRLDVTLRRNSDRECS